MSEVEYRYADITLGDGRITGIAMRYGDRAAIGEFREEFAVGALRFDDVTLNVMHNPERVVARSNGTMQLRNASDALHVEARIVDTQDGQDAIKLIDAGVITGMSVEFRCLEDSFTGNLRRVEKADLLAIALVDRPAYGETAVALAKRWRKMHKVRRRWL